MKRNLSPNIAVIALFAALTISSQSFAQQPHYTLVDLGTLGGAQSYINPVLGPQTVAAVNRKGAIVGFADTPASDPFPNFCFWDCFVVNAFLSDRSGVLANLGALPGGGSSLPNWITTNGLVAGLSENGETDPLYSGLPQLRAVLWEHGKIIDLKTLPEGGYQSEANAVNRLGQVVGAALNTMPDDNSMQSGNGWLWGGISPAYPYQTRAFIWDQDNGMQDLGTLGGTDAQAQLINDRGQVVGVSYTGSNSTPFCNPYPLVTDAFIWEKDSGMTDLGSFGGTCTTVADLNQRGQVVGESNLKGDQLSEAFVWEDGKLHHLGGSLGGSFTGAQAISEAGQVAGFAYLEGDVNFHATLWKQIGKMTDLGVLGSDQCSDAIAINGRGQVVGISISSCTAEEPTVTAFLWEDGSLFDLNDLIPPGSPLFLTGVATINDRGEIAGQGVDGSGNEHAFLLVPCDQNHPNVEGCDYSLVDAAEAARVSAGRSPQQKLPAGTKLRGVRGLFLGPMGHTPTPSLRERGRQAVSTPLGDDFGSVSGEAERSAQHEAVAEISSCSTSERAASNGEIPARGYVFRGACSVNDNKADTLTGLCQGPIPFSHTCGGSWDPSQCPSGQKAREPEWEPCGFATIRIDVKRPCEFKLQ